MFRKIFFLSLLFLLFPNKVNASEKQFDIQTTALYEVLKDGRAEITQEIKITNLTEFYFTPNYTINTGFSNISSIQAFNSDGSIPTTILEGDKESKAIRLNFENRYAGLNKTNNFTLKFETSDIAKKQGNVWEVIIPGLVDESEFSNYQVNVLVPDSFGKASIVKPLKKASSQTLTFFKNEIGKSGIYILYGDKQYYKFNLKYNISNPNLFPVKTEIALPPTTNYQNSTISSFSENPENVVRDPDGNWIAEYRLLPQQKKTIEVKGVIEVLSDGREVELDNKQVKDYTSPKKYWDSNSKLVENAAKDLNDAYDIYNFVQETLFYNRNKIATDGLRLGGKGALEDNKNSVCLEFTDLFISLARAKGIPSRAVEGFAYTSNSDLRPLSLVNDILHAWPEYYDFEKKKWIMVDPTWGKTTNGMDYFNSLDFSHVAFAVKGSDSEYPIPAGGYKFSQDSKDVSVIFASESDFSERKKLEISDTFPKSAFPKFNIKGSILVQNTGNTAQENLTVIVTTSGGSKREFVIDYLPPYGYKEISTSFSNTPFLTKDPFVITIQIGEQEYKKDIKISFIPDVNLILIIGGIIGVSTITAAVTFHTGSLLVQRQRKKSSLRR